MPKPKHRLTKVQEDMLRRSLLKKLGFDGPEQLEPTIRIRISDKGALRVDSASLLDTDSARKQLDAVRRLKNRGRRTVVS